MACSNELPRRRGDKVIRLHPLLFHGQDIMGFDNPFYIWDLDCEIIGHWRSVGLIIRIHCMPEIRPLGIKGHCQKFRGFFLDDPEQYIGKAVCGMGWQTICRGQGRNGMVGTIKIGGAINKIYRGFFRHGRIVTGGFLIGNYSIVIQCRMQNCFALALSLAPCTLRLYFQSFSFPRTVYRIPSTFPFPFILLPLTCISKPSKQSARRPSAPYS